MTKRRTARRVARRTTRRAKRRTKRTMTRQQRKFKTASKRCQTETKEIILSNPRAPLFKTYGKCMRKELRK